MTRSTAATVRRTGAEYRSDQGSFAPRPAMEQRCEGYENGNNEIRQGKHCSTYCEKWGHASLPRICVFLVFVQSPGRGLLKKSDTGLASGVVRRIWSLLPQLLNILAIGQHYVLTFDAAIHAHLPGVRCSRLFQRALGAAIDRLNKSLPLVSGALDQSSFLLDEGEQVDLEVTLGT